MARPPIDVLHNVPLFAGLDRSDLERLAARFQERSFSEGSTIMEEGATGTSFFVVLDGNADVTVGGERKATLGPGDHFGEMAVVDDGVRSASVTAATDVRTAFLTPWEFRPFVEENPKVAWSLLQSLSRRLRDAQAARGGSRRSRPSSTRRSARAGCRLPQRSPGSRRSC